VNLRSLEAPGHFGFLACQPAWQKQLLRELLALSCSDSAAAPGCAGWAASGASFDQPSCVLLCAESRDAPSYASWVLHLAICAL